MARIFLSIGAILAALAVGAGAFASHALKAQLSERSLAIFETGARYQMYHALALIAIAILLANAENTALRSNPQWLTASGIAFIVGIVLFSGSLYGLSLTGIKVLGAITPLGGVAFIVGWCCLAIAPLIRSL